MLIIINKGIYKGEIMKIKQPKRKIKSVKKIRSFNIDEKIYSKLMEILEDSNSPIGLSVLVNEFLRQFCEYLIKAKELLQREDTDSDLPLADVIYDSLKIKYFDSMSFAMFKEFIELIKHPTIKNIMTSEGYSPLWAETRVSNLIDIHEASKRNMSVGHYLDEKHGPESRLKPIEDEK
jgi:hypothetical protein